MLLRISIHTHTEEVPQVPEQEVISTGDVLLQLSWTSTVVFVWTLQLLCGVPREQVEKPRVSLTGNTAFLRKNIMRCGFHLQLMQQPSASVVSVPYREREPS